MIENKKARHNYQIKETLEAGIVLTGGEVKSIRDNRVQIDDAFVKSISGNLYLVNADIAKYKYTNDEKYDSLRTRKLLVHRKEIDMLSNKSKQWGMVLIPLKMYLQRGRVKLLIGLGKGLKKYERKDAEKNKTLDRELHRERRKYMIQ